MSSCLENYCKYTVFSEYALFPEVLSPKVFKGTHKNENFFGSDFAAFEYI